MRRCQEIAETSLPGEVLFDGMERMAELVLC
jgi:hypothetical protein